jgi:membrane protease subunit HflK
MIQKLTRVFFVKSPWDNSGNQENIFSRKRNNGPDFFKNFQNFQFDFNLKTILMILSGLFVLWLVSGVYEIKEGEQAVIVRFGKFVRKGEPGLNYHLPEPIERVVIERVNQSRRVEIGYRSAGSVTKNQNNDSSRYIAAESTMLTGDENIIDLNCDVMWHIKDLEAFVFNIANPEEAVKAAAESAIREVVGETPISNVLSNRKQEIVDRTEVLTQKILDQYSTGITVEKVQLLKAEPPAEVIDAYRDVQTSKADKEREINQAQSYNNDILPRARGEAAKLLEEAEGYKQEVISRADGDTSRFNAVLKEYIQAKQVTRDRLALEAAEDVLRGSSKTVMSEGVLPHMAITNGSK